jgi:site-specific recombinase XerD
MRSSATIADNAFRCLRKTYATVLVEPGASARSISELLVRPR